MPDDLAGELRAFARTLRSEGVPVSTGQVLAFLDAVAATGPADVYWCGHATLVTHGAERPVYDAVFRRFFAGAAPAPRELVVPAQRVRPAPEGERDAAREAGAPSIAGGRALASDVELLRTKSFAAMSAEELAQLARLMASMSLTRATRRSRRTRRAPRGALDLRATVRGSMRTGGEPVSRAWRCRRVTPRPIVLVLDVSASMMASSRALMLFAHATLRTHARCEAFCFSTRLTRVSRALARADPDAALAAAASKVEDWDGGTRIGESIKAFLDGHGHRGAARGAVVVICSDGLDVGDASLLGEQMRRLRRLAHRVVWINPLLEQDGYEPLARGMRAALPHVDTFASGHSLAALERLQL